MSITLSSIPEELKTNKSVAPYIARAVELQSVNPVVSYYCKIYVLEHILSNKLHNTSKDIERFTIELLDETEALKNSEEDEGVNKALQDKAISASIVLSFAYKLFNSCLESISQYTRSTNKAALVGKFRATLVFLSLLDVFVQNDEVEWEKLSGGKAKTGAEFEMLNKEKIKVLKYQLSRLLKDEVEYSDEKDEDLEDELNQELAELEQGGGVEAQDDGAPEQAGPILPSAPTADAGSQVAKKDSPELPSAPQGLSDNEESPVLPSAPTDLASDTSAGPDSGLPSAPHFSPNQDDDSFKLPGAPKFLPDDDLSHINKTSSIQVFPPGNSDPAPTDTARVAPAPSARPVAHHQVTKEDVTSIIDHTESIGKIQKHAKFAVSALNYDDLDTAEKELRQGLALLELVKRQSGAGP